MDDKQKENSNAKSTGSGSELKSDRFAKYETLKSLLQSKFPDTFEGFGYKFNEFGQLRHIVTDQPFEFNVRKDDQVYNQKRYEAIGEVVTNYVYHLLEVQGKLIRMTLPLDAKEDEPTTFIFHTDDAFSNEKLVILIHGSGVVRAGQWARRLIINDTLNSGTQIPFIRRAKGLGYGVIVLNTNDNRREVNGTTHKIRGSESAEAHASYVWTNLIMKRAAAKRIGFVAHSYGGIVTVNLYRSFPESFHQRVYAAAFTDSPHNLVLQGLSPSEIEWFRNVARNWVSNNLPLDTFLPAVDSYEVECYSAGTQRHDLTSWMCFTSVYEFIDRKFCGLPREL